MLPVLRRSLLLAVALSGALAQELPEGPGRAETVKLCKNCHDLGKSVSLRQDREGWRATLTKMIAMGTKGTEEEFTVILDYLSKHYPAGEVPPLNMNKATAIEMESRLLLRRSHAAAIIAWREKNGPFKSLDDLKKIPSIDFEKIEARKDRLVF